MYLHEGINLLEVLYYDGGMEPKLILSWSEDGNEYKIIPEEFYRKGDVSFEVSSLPIEESDQDIEPNVLSEEEIAEGWKLLYDGKTTDGWHTFNQPGTIGSKWTSKDGALNFEGRESFRYMLGGRMMEMGSGNKSEDGGLDIVSDETFENFELKLDWKISYGGNSGITYTTLEGNEYGEIWHTSPEMQVLHDQVHKDGVIYTHRSGDLYDLIAADPVVVKPQGEWNRIKIVKDHGKIQHWMNGYKVVEYDTNTDEWTEMISKSKFSEFVNYASPGPGHIGLQDHGNEVSFRNIKIRVLE